MSPTVPKPRRLTMDEMIRRELEAVHRDTAAKTVGGNRCPCGRGNLTDPLPGCSGALTSPCCGRVHGSMFVGGRP